MAQVSTDLVLEDDPIIANYCFKWTISEFISETSKKLTSPSFYAGVNNLSEWYLNVYPNGYGKINEGYMSIYLHLKSSHESAVTALYTFSILNLKQEKVNLMESTTICKLCPKSKGYGKNKFIARDFLLDKANGLLTNDDELTVVCDIKVYGKKEEKLFKIILPEHLHQLLISKQFSDVTLVVGEKEFQAHKSILAARSPVFSAMFNQKMEESRNNRINITEIKSNVLEEMLYFIYTDKAPNLTKMTEDLLAAADKYQLERLKLMCEEVLCLNLVFTKENATKILTLAEHYNLNQLKPKIIDFICNHTTDIVEEEGFESMATLHPNLSVEIVKALAAKNQLLTNQQS